MKRLLRWLYPQREEKAEDKQNSTETASMASNRDGCQHSKQNSTVCQPTGSGNSRLPHSIDSTAEQSSRSFEDLQSNRRLVGSCYDMNNETERMDVTESESVTDQSFRSWEIIAKVPKRKHDSEKQNREENVRVINPERRVFPSPCTTEKERSKIQTTERSNVTQGNDGLEPPSKRSKMKELVQARSSTKSSRVTTQNLKAIRSERNQKPGTLKSGGARIPDTTTVNRQADKVLGEDKVSSKLLSHLQGSLAKEYLAEPIEELEDFRLEVRDRDKMKSYMANLDILFERSHTVVYGLAGFGKSTLCRKLACSWAKCIEKAKLSDNEKYRYFPGYGLCILLDSICTDLDIEESLLQKCQQQCSGAVGIREEIIKVLDKSILILDCFQHLDGASLKKLEEFLEGKMSNFRTLLVTTRPVSGTSLVSTFKRYVDIRGFDYANLTGNMKACVAELPHPFVFFNGFSLLFQQMVRRVLRSSSKPDTLFDLTQSILTLMCGRYAELRGKQGIVFAKLGICFLRALVKRQNTFELGVLEKEVGKDVIKSGIFVKTGKVGDQEKITVCHDIIMRFFCVWYLRRTVAKVKDMKEMMTTLKSKGIFVNITDVFVHPLTKIVTFDALPGIVMEQKTCNFACVRDFNLIEDVPKQFSVSPWTDCSLLLRCREETLRRFQIETLDETENIQDKFECVLNLLDFSNLTVSTSYFRKQKSGEIFLKVLVKNEYLESLPAVCVFCRHEELPDERTELLNTMRELVLDIKCSDLDDFYPLLYGLFKHFHSCSLPQSWENIPCSELIFLLLKTVTKSSKPCFMQISIGADADSNLERISWEVLTLGDGSFPSVYKTTTTERDTAAFRQDECHLNRNDFVRELRLFNKSFVRRPEMYLTVCVMLNPNPNLQRVHV